MPQQSCPGRWVIPWQTLAVLQLPFNSDVGLLSVISATSLWISNISWCLSKGIISYVWTADWLGPHMAFVLWASLISDDDNESRHLNLNVTRLKLISVLSSEEILNILMTPESMFKWMRFISFTDILYCHCNIGSTISSMYFKILKRYASEEDEKSEMSLYDSIIDKKSLFIFLTRPP